MAQILQAMPHLCAPEPPREAQPAVKEEDREVLARFEKVRPYADSVWGPAAWTALQADILSLPRELDAHEFCMFKVYLALRARYLPCSACALHFEKALREMPNHAVMRTRAGLLRWLTTVQNDVNRRKQRAPLPEDEILALLAAKAAVRAPHEQKQQQAEEGAEEEGEEEEQGEEQGELEEGTATRYTSSAATAAAPTAAASSPPPARPHRLLSTPAAIPLALGLSAVAVGAALAAIHYGRRSRASRHSPRP